MYPCLHALPRFFLQVELLDDEHPFHAASRLFADPAAVMDSARQIHDARGKVMLTPLSTVKGEHKFWEDSAGIAEEGAKEDAGGGEAKEDLGEAMRLESIVDPRPSATVAATDKATPTATATDSPAGVDASHHAAVVLR